jgi:hypothetical protein
MSGMRAGVVLAIVLALSACGGGGGGGGAAPAAVPPPAPVPDPPPDPDPDPVPDPTPDPDPVPDPTPDPDPDPVSPITVSGVATYDRVPHTGSGALFFDGVTRQPIAGATVQALAESGALIDEVRSGADGEFSLSVPASTRLRIRVRAELRDPDGQWDFVVVDNVEASPRAESECWAVENTRSKPVYAVETGFFDSGNEAALVRDLHAASGWDGTRYSGDRAAAPFAVLAVADSTRELLLSADPNLILPSLKLNWSEDNVPAADSGFNPCSGEIATSAYVSSGGSGQIYLLGDDASDADEFDYHVIAHELGHYYEDRLARSDSPGGAHSIFDRLDLRLAFSEGWGNAFSAMVTGDAVYKDSQGVISGFSFDVDRNSVLNAGWYNESSVHSILYDLFDTGADGVDSVALGFTPLHEILTGPQRATRSVTSVFSFVSALKASQSALSANIDQLVAAQDMVAETMDEWASTETNDAGRADDVLPVYHALPLDGPAAQVCSAILSPGDFYSKLGIRQYLRLTLGSDGPVVISASGESGTDPDIVLYDAGFRRFSESADDGFESATWDLEAGDYVVEVYEWGNLTSPPKGRTCFEVTARPGLALGNLGPGDGTDSQASDLKTRQPGLPTGKPRPSVQISLAGATETRGARFALRGRLSAGAGTEVLEVKARSGRGTRVDSMDYAADTGFFAVEGWIDNPAHARVGIEVEYGGDFRGIRRWTLSATPSGLPPLRRKPVRTHAGVRAFRSSMSR